MQLVLRAVLISWNSSFVVFLAHRLHQEEAKRNPRGGSCSLSANLRDVDLAVLCFSGMGTETTLYLLETLETLQSAILKQAVTSVDS
jgi:hypothetical protein